LITGLDFYKGNLGLHFMLEKVYVYVYSRAFGFIYINVVLRYPVSPETF